MQKASAADAMMRLCGFCGNLVRQGFKLRQVERAKGIEPSYAAWEAAVLPLNYARERFRAAIV
jgi:hypothetical protein